MDSHIYPAEPVYADQRRGLRAAHGPPRTAGCWGAQGRGAQARSLEAVPTRQWGSCTWADHLL